MPITVMEPPVADLNCTMNWKEQDVDNSVRTVAEDGSPMVRRRFTGVVRMASVTVTYKKELYDDFMKWFRVTTLDGSIATWIKEPSGKETAWRFTGPAEIEWVHVGEAFTASYSIIRNDAWPEKPL